MKVIRKAIKITEENTDCESFKGICCRSGSSGNCCQTGSCCQSC